MRHNPVPEPAVPPLEEHRGSRVKLNLNRFRSLAIVLCAYLCAGAVPPAQAAPTPPDNMVYVPAGPFLMGTNESDKAGADVPLGNNDARPLHTANTGAFFIDITDVTNAQYRKFCQTTHYPYPPQWTNGNYPSGQDNYPVVHVSFYEAKAYAAWIGKRLPTETEWEKAARGTDGRIFPWGSGWDPGRIVYGANGPQDVGSKPASASPYGVLDMAGNVFDWTSSWFDAYPNAPVQVSTFGKEFKVVRGGAFMGYQNIFQTFYRTVCKPESKTEWVGFRCVKDAPAE